MLQRWTLIAACVLVLISTSMTTAKKVKVSVYYETLCPDSIVFETKHLYPVWKEHAEDIILEMIPYGKAIQNKKDGKWEFDCQHGERECLRNKYHACIFNSTSITLEQQMGIVNCMMSRSTRLGVHYDACTKQQEVPADVKASILKCSTGPEGDEVLAWYGDKTWSLETNLSFVPTVIFDDVFNQGLQDEAMENFKEVIIRMIE